MCIRSALMSCLAAFFVSSVIMLGEISLLYRVWIPFHDTCPKHLNVDVSMRCAVLAGTSVCLNNPNNPSISICLYIRLYVYLCVPCSCYDYNLESPITSSHQPLQHEIQPLCALLLCALPFCDNSSCCTVLDVLFRLFRSVLFYLFCVVCCREALSASHAPLHMARLRPLSACPSLHVSISPSIYLSMYLPLHPSIYPCIYLSIHLFIHLSIYSSIYLSIHLFTQHAQGR